MREIKFRAWLTLSDYDNDGNDKNYFGMANTISVHHDGGIGFSLDEGQAIFGGDVFERALDNGTVYEYEEWCYWEGQCELMQYTGLKDKNGKEIYEGDIVKDIHQVGIGARTSMITRESVYEIKIPDIYMGWSPDEFQDIDDLAKYTSTSHKQYGIEVIGNIYETPGLVK